MRVSFELQLKPLRTQQGEDQVPDQHQGKNHAKDVFDIHGDFLFQSRSQPRTYASETTKKTIVNKTKATSIMVCSLG